MIETSEKNPWVVALFAVQSGAQSCIVVWAAGYGSKARIAGRNQCLDNISGLWLSASCNDNIGSCFQKPVMASFAETYWEGVLYTPPAGISFTPVSSTSTVKALSCVVSKLSGLTTNSCIRFRFIKSNACSRVLLPNETSELYQSLTQQCVWWHYWEIRFYCQEG